MGLLGIRLSRCNRDFIRLRRQREPRSISLAGLICADDRKQQDSSHGGDDGRGPNLPLFETATLVRKIRYEFPAFIQRLGAQCRYKAQFRSLLGKGIGRFLIHFYDRTDLGHTDPREIGVFIEQLRAGAARSHMLPEIVPFLGGEFARRRDGAKLLVLFTASTLYRKACDGGYMDGCAGLGSLSSNGHGVPQDYSRATALFQDACDKGSQVGCVMLGSLYYSGRGVAQDYSKAIDLFQKACDGRYMTGCALLGRLYESGYGVNRDYSKAGLLYQKACDAGTMVGCTMLGNLYSNGEGVARNSVQAMALYREGCSGGNMDGSVKLGDFYEQKGKVGVSKGFVEARSFYQRACDEGTKIACDKLRTLP